MIQRQLTKERVSQKKSDKFTVSQESSETKSLQRWTTLTKINFESDKRANENKGD